MIHRNAGVGWRYLEVSITIGFKDGFQALSSLSRKLDPDTAPLYNITQDSIIQNVATTAKGWTFKSTTRTYDQALTCYPFVLPIHHHSEFTRIWPRQHNSIQCLRLLSLQANNNIYQYIRISSFENPRIFPA